MEEIINEIINKMIGKADLIELKNTLYMVLSNYEISPKEFEIRVENERWKQVLQMFLNRKVTSGRSDKTIKAYGYHIGRFLSFIGKDVKDITENDVFEYFRLYKESRNVSNGYLDFLRLEFSSFFNWCYKKGLIDKSPMEEIEPIKKEKKLKKPYSDEELDKMRYSCKCTRDRALIEFMYSTGVRVSELAHINIADVDFTNKEAIVFGKGAKERTVFLSDICVMYLKEYLESRTDDNEALFTSRRKPYKRLDVRGIQTVVEQLGEITGIEGVGCHRFRRTTATNLLKKGTPLEEVQLILGHEKPETTLIYAKVNKESAKNHHRKFMCA